MTVEQLVDELYKCNPDDEVVFGTDCGTAAGIVRAVTADGRYGVGKKAASKRVVRLDCRMEYYEGEKCK